MSNFKELQTNLQQARKDRESGRVAVFHAKEKLKKVEREITYRQRGSDENKAIFSLNDTSFENLESEGLPSEVIQELRSLKDQEFIGKDVFLENVKAKIGEDNVKEYQSLLLKFGGPFSALYNHEIISKDSVSQQEFLFTEHLKAEDILLKDFLPFTDPREHIQNFSDKTPVLLFPVRLETRFKKIPTSTGGVQHQLWVRIFPDECSIDTFDDTLSQAELIKVKKYWTNLWKAGKATNEEVGPFIQNKEKGAWRELMGVFNAGRSYWITKKYHPEKPDDIPKRNSESDVLLIIPTEQLSEDVPQDAIKNYWKAIFLSNGNAQEDSATFTELMNETGADEESAIKLIKRYRPENIDEERIETSTEPDITVAFLEFSKSQNVDSKLMQWSHAARVTTFPDKFLLLGFLEGDTVKPIIEELGECIPDPLIIGPDPGEDIDKILKEALGDDYEKVPDEEKAEKYVEYLSQRSDTKWLFDFEEAIKVGMGFKIDLSEQVYNKGFGRLFVLGVNLSEDENEGQSSLEQLIKHHHFGNSGFSILPQGIPTNNTEDSRSGYSITEDADEAYLRYQLEVTEDDPSDRKKNVMEGGWQNF